MRIVLLAGVLASAVRAEAMVLPAGSYMFHPAGGVHWNGSDGNEMVNLQIIG